MEVLFTILTNYNANDFYNYIKSTFLVVVVNFTGMPTIPTSIYLSWALPTVPGLEEEYQYYIVHCDEVQTSREWTFFAVEPHATIISLHPYYEYDCRVAIVGNITYSYNTPITLLTHQAGNNSFSLNTFAHATKYNIVSCMLK